MQLRLSVQGIVPNSAAACANKRRAIRVGVVLDLYNQDICILQAQGYFGVLRMVQPTSDTGYNSA